MAIIVFWAKKINTDNDISNREDRFVPLIVGIVSYFIGFIVCLIFNASNFLALLLLCYSVNTGVVLLFTIKWKISVHTTGLSGPVAALILLLGPFGAIFAVLYPIVIWSRVLLKKHTLVQAITGGVQGFFLTVLEMYLFSHLLNMPLYGLVSLEESILYILAIIATPIALGILSYVDLSNKKIIFYISQAVLLIRSIFWCRLMSLQYLQ
jgi:membrane-associated phospholipid phosphatase